MANTPKKGEKYTNQHELKTQTKRLIGEVAQGERYVVLRYSRPVAVLLSMKDYCEMTRLDPAKCNQCQADIKKTLAKINKKL
jgi:prevent-host-death family protein